MRAFLELFFVICIGLFLGGLLSWGSIQNNNGFGALKLGSWIGWPAEGSADADPYSKAKVAADGKVPLGAAEGLALRAKTDGRGDQLLRECQYKLEGQTPTARLWTLSAHELDGGALVRNNGFASNLVSRNVLRNSDGTFTLESGPNLAGQNWLETHGKGPFEFILRLYDSPLTSTSGVISQKMPAIILLGCES